MAHVNILILLTAGLSFMALFDVQFVTAFEGRIVNGTQAKEGEFPFIVSLRRSSTGRHSCGASLINRAWVLTAAHCVARAKPELLNIQFGSVELNRNSTKVANVSKVFVHPGYLPSNKLIHDIALLKLKTPVAFNERVGAVHLPEMERITPANESATLIGWGLNATGGTLHKRLQKVQLQTFSDEECSSRHQTALHATTICAGVPEGGKGQCSGDSGGPLLVNGTLVGIVSWSRKPCTVAPYPGVLTEVSAYVDWILQTMGDEAEHNNDVSDESLEQLMSGNLIIVSLRHRSNLKHFCAGTIVAPSWVLTAAHCFTFVQLPQEVKVQYGSSSLNIQKPELADVTEIIKHEGYNPTVAIHDIALLRLEDPLTFDCHTTAVKFSEMTDNTGALADGKMTLIGWGSNETCGSLQIHLQKVDLKWLSLSECRRKLNALLHATNICTGALPEYKGQCSGDSGGPLIYNGTQIGLVSWSFKPCATKPGVFTGVLHYARWILDNINA